MRITGWDTDTLRRQPARVVRAHFARIFVGLIWNPELAASVAGPGPTRGGYADLGDYATARAQRGRQVTAMAAISELLWPEDE